MNCILLILSLSLMISSAGALEYVETQNHWFASDVNKLFKFPVAPSGHCLEGCEKMEKALQNTSYVHVVAIKRSTQERKGHAWILVKEPNLDRWIAADSYYGVVEDPYRYSLNLYQPDVTYLTCQAYEGEELGYNLTVI